nr:6081_t:CDS:2 [Entrophospora candida]
MEDESLFDYCEWDFDNSDEFPIDLEDIESWNMTARYTNASESSHARANRYGKNLSLNAAILHNNKKTRADRIDFKEKELEIKQKELELDVKD